MCGIAGALDLRGNREFPLERLRAMCRALRHRGPDDEHVHGEPGLAMGVRRLALVDVRRGKQPLSNEDGTVWVAFNGELFDHDQLLNDLAKRGHRLATRCDTEVWVHWYEDLADDVFERARGQFAVALWDRAARTLWLARDRIGICPLYYVQTDAWLLWASEIKALLASGLVKASPNPHGVDHLFCFGTAPVTQSFFQGVRNVPPGHFLKVRGERVELRQYWDFEFPDAGDMGRRASVKDLADELEHLLRRAVRRRLRGDVPVVSYLSGGVDSATVLALACQESGRSIPSFTIGLDGSRRDERSKADRSARLVESPLTTVAMDRQAIATTYPELLLAAEGPVLDTSCACMIRLAAEVRRQGYKVVLTGEGADEALGGYPWNHLLKLRWLPGLDDRAVSSLLGGRRVMIEKHNGVVRRASPRPLTGVRTPQQAFIEVIARCRDSLYSTGMWEQLRGRSPFDDLNLTNPAISRWHPLNQSSYLDYRVFLPGLLLAAKGDRSAMHSSVETRPPYLDEDVIDFCMGLPPSLKMRRFTGKWLLRQVAQRLLPHDVAYRNKQGFRTTFAGTFLSDNRPSWVDQLLSPESLRATGYFDARAVQTHCQRRSHESWLGLPNYTYDVGLTSVVATQLWHHLFFGGLCDLPEWSPDGS